jgi:deoxyribodipyrimidine photo-lyase
MKKRAIIWFRNDLRLHDNEALVSGQNLAQEIIPVFIFDERIFLGETKFGFRHTGRYRAKFILESVIDLRNNLRAKGSDLYVRIGKPEDILPAVARETGCSWVICNRERTRDEVRVQDAMEQQLWSIGVELLYTRGKMLYHTQDLPTPVHHTPDTFSTFRKDTEAITKVRPPLETPHQIPATTAELASGDMPTLFALGHDDFEPDARGVLDFKGGETEGMKRLKHYLWDTDSVADYKQTRNGMIGADYSTKFSPWLSQGCLSPKLVFHEIAHYEQKRTKNESTYWVFFELLWRDYFRLMAKKYGNRIFMRGGPHDKPFTNSKSQTRLFDAWAEGKTGVPFVDAHMRELNATGWMSNRGRQNAASFLVKDLKVNWVMGAEYFESLLIDYDPASNYGNWNYVAGVGSDPREDRYFNQLTQARAYDPQADFVRLWCTELKNVPGEKAHRPDLLTVPERKAFKVQGYPDAVVQMSKWESK